MRFIDRALYLPKEWTEDRERRRAAGVPEEIAFAPKPSLARAMIERTLAAAAPGRAGLSPIRSTEGIASSRFFLEEAEQPYVLAVSSQQSVWLGFGQRRVKALIAKVPPEAWAEISVGAGAKGPRLFAWAVLRINHPYEPRRWQRFVLLRRSSSNEQEISAYLVFGLAKTTVEELARIAGRRSRH
jgi:SRSO17 transposase